MIAAGIGAGKPKNGGGEERVKRQRGYRDSRRLLFLGPQMRGTGGTRQAGRAAGVRLVVLSPLRGYSILLMLSQDCA